MKKVLITGGSSFLGRNVIENFTDFQFTALINEQKLNYKNVENIKLDSYSQINEIIEVENFDYVFHFASQRHISEDLKSIDEYIKVNIKFGVTILQALKKSNIKLFIYSSSLWQDLLGEQKNLYTLSKQHFDDYLKYFSIESKFNILSLRIGDQYGKNDFRNKIIPYIKNNENNEKIEFNSNGEHLLSLVHIADILKAIESKLSNSEIKKYEILRLCSHPITIKEFIEIYKKTREKTFTPIYGQLSNDLYQKEDFIERVRENIWLNTVDIVDGLKSL